MFYIGFPISFNFLIVEKQHTQTLSNQAFLYYFPVPLS